MLETCNCSKTCWFVLPPPLQPDNSTVCSRAGRPGLRATRARSQGAAHTALVGASQWASGKLGPCNPFPFAQCQLQGEGSGPALKRPVGLAPPVSRWARVSHWGSGSGSVRGTYLPSPQKPAPSCGAPPVPARLAPLRRCTGHWNRPRSHLLGSEAAQVVALANEGFAFLKQVVGDRGAGVQGFEVLTQLV